MKKQIIYPQFIPRIFALTIDFTIILLVFAPVINIIANYIFLYIFQDFFIAHSVDTSSAEEVLASVKTQDFMNYLTIYKFVAYPISIFVVNIIFMGIYFVGFNYKFSATPGKFIMRMKIANADDYSKPSLYDFIKRFFGYITAPISIFMILFTARGTGLHDNIANTVVIKR